MSGDFVEKQLHSFENQRCGCSSFLLSLNYHFPFPFLLKWRQNVSARPRTCTRPGKEVSVGFLPWPVTPAPFALALPWVTDAKLLPF